MTTPPRRWSYSLRTLFVFVTVFGCWLGYQVNWIRQRHQAFGKANLNFKSYGIPPPRAPGFLSFFGERGFEYVSVELSLESGDTPTAQEQLEITLLESLFPEAIVWHFPKR